MDSNLTSNGNEQNLNLNELERTANVEKSASNSSEETRAAYLEAKALAKATFAQLDEATRSSFSSFRRKFEESRSRLVDANVERDEIWRDLPDDVQKALADATRDKPTASISDLIELKPEEISLEKFDAALRARRRQLQARRIFYEDRSNYRNPLIDRFLLRCADSGSIEAPFPSEEFEDKAIIIRDLGLCDSVDDAMKRAEARWRSERPCVVANNLREWVEGETRKERRKRIREVKRELFREFANSDEWKTYASSFGAIARALFFSSICVVLTWVAIIKWNLVYLLRYENIFPRKSDAYLFLYAATPVVWAAIALVYRNVVLFRRKRRYAFKEFKKNLAEAKRALK